MALLLAALGAFLYLQLRSDLDETIDDNLRSRLGEVSALAASSPSLGEGVTAAFADEDETFVQVLRCRRNRCIQHAGRGRRRRLVSARRGSAERQRASRSRERCQLPGLDGGARLLVAPAEADGLTVVVGASLDDRDETLSSAC